MRRCQGVHVNVASYQLTVEIGELVAIVKGTARK